MDAAEGFVPGNLTELMTLCKQYGAARCIPKCYWDKPSDILVVIQLARALEVPDILMLQNSYVIDNRPSIMTQLMLALAMRSPAWDESAYKLEWVGEPDDANFKAVFTCRRKGGQLVVAEFSAKDAKRAKLANVHNVYPRDMLGWRAMSRGLRRAFADMLAGLYTVEEMRHEDQIRSAIENVDLQTPDQMRDAMTTKPRPVGEPTPADAPPPPEPEPEAPKAKPGDDAKLTRETIAEYFKRLDGPAKTALLLKCGLGNISDIETRGPADLKPILGLAKAAAQKGKTNGK